MMKERTLDLEAPNSAELETFVTSMAYILRVVLDKGFIGVEFEKEGD